MQLKIFIFLIGFSFFANAAIRDVPYHFDSKKIASTHTPLEFFRTFADYFYLLEKENHENQTFVQTYWANSGWCFGDTHLENFGTLLLESGQSTFTVNDWDDAGPCPVILDLFRLAISSDLFDTQISLEKIFSAYQRGLLGQNDQIPFSVQTLIAKSKNKGISPHPKVIDKNQFIRTAESTEIIEADKNELMSVISKLNAKISANYKWQDGLKTSKLDGGSFGLARYQLLLRQNDQLLHVELKEQVTPSIYPLLRAEQMPSVQEKILTSLKFSQQNQFSLLYGATSIQNKSMLIRPRFAGNSSLKASNYTSAELESIVPYEANLLGFFQKNNPQRNFETIHLNSSDLQKFLADTKQFSLFIQAKYRSLSALR